MAKNSTKVALIYDFDGTLSTCDMQNYGLIPELGMKPKAFWKKANQWSVDNCADQVTGSMYYFTKTAKEKGVKLTKENFFRCGQNIEYFEGVEKSFLSSKPGLSGLTALARLWIWKSNIISFPPDMKKLSPAVPSANILPTYSAAAMLMTRKAARFGRPGLSTIRPKPSIFPKSTKGSANWKTALSTNSCLTTNARYLLHE